MRQDVEIENINVENNNYDLLDITLVLLRRKRMIVFITLTVTIMTVIVSLTMPPIYRGETTILPPQQQSSMASQLINQLGALSGNVASAFGVNLSNPNEMYIDMLQSKRVFDNIIRKFDLMQVYEEKFIADARKKLSDNLIVKENKKSGIITIAVEDKDPQRAANLTNGFVEELRNLTKGLAVTEAAQRRLFFEDQLKDAKALLVKTEDELKEFQEKTGAVKIDAQAEALIRSIADLKAQVVAKEVENKVLRSFSTRKSPDIQIAEQELEGLKQQLAKLEEMSQRSSVIAPTGSIPEIETEYIRRMRDFKFNETLYELLLSQYQAAKIDESRDATIVQVIDYASVPEKRERPKRKEMVVIAFASGFFVSALLTFLFEYAGNILNDPENKSRIELLKKRISIRKGN